VSTKLKTYLSDKDTPKDQLTICLNEPFEHGILENVNPDNGGEIPRIGQSIECFTAEELEQGLFWVKFSGKPGRKFLLLENFWTTQVLRV